MHEETKRQSDNELKKCREKHIYTYLSMATKPGIFSNWPWKPLGNFKYLVLVPWAVHSVYSFATKGEKERDLFNLLIFPFLLARMLHGQLWNSVARHRTAKGNTRITDRDIDFEQVDRESHSWDDQIILNGILAYIANMSIPGASHLPIWSTKGAIITVLLHMGPVEFIYYWFHRALHHHLLYSRYHSHHHSFIVTEPISAVVHPFVEVLAYDFIFGMPAIFTVLTGTASIITLFAYPTFFDFMNLMGHCNFEFIPKWMFSTFPPLKYLMYTPTFHALHHTQFRTNYCLFMPFYDYIYGTMDKSSEVLYETSLKRPEVSPDVVHLTHLTTTDSIFHLRPGFASLSSKPHASNTKWYLRVVMWPLTLFCMVFTWVFALQAFISERNNFKKLKLQTWVVPKYKMQYSKQWQRKGINNLIEEAIIEAEKKGAKVLSLGLLNQHEELNGNGELYIQRNPQLKIKIVDGSSLAAAVVLNSIPKETTQVVLRGKVNKVASAIAVALCHKGIQVVTLHEEEYHNLKHIDELGTNLILTKSYDRKIWLVGDGLTEREQLKAPEGTLFIPFSHFPPNQVRKDCYYHSTPALMAPKSLENMHACENWLPRRVMSAWRVAGIIHGLEEWDVQECGGTVFSIHKIWEATLQHGFRPLSIPAAH